MLDNFDPKERKVILIFLALLVLGLIYVGTHDLQLSQPNMPYKVPIQDEEVSNSGVYL
tara:strand:+ start:37 stop:210 length:174 start_codon:yes stop_codon:yes gene_type:complete